MSSQKDSPADKALAFVKHHCYPEYTPPSAYLWHYPEPWLPFDKLRTG
jgi:hypothetical protein